MFEHGRQFLDRAGLAVEKTLDEEDVLACHEGELLLRLDALSDEIETQIAGQRRNGADDRLSFCRLDRLSRERLIDLHLVDREAVEIAQAAVARAEIVERQTHAQRGDSPKLRFYVGALRNEGAFGDFQFEAIRRQTGLAQNLVDAGEQVGLLKLQRRQIHRHANMRGPSGRVEAGAAQDPGADLDDQTAVFGDGNEDAGRNQSALGMSPPRQRLHCDDRAAS
jgi:hypothetical protein